MKRASQRTWRRHSNPWSVWTRILSYPLVYLPFWNRSLKQGVAVAVWFAANPVLFPAPEDNESWATRGVLGEELWTAERPRDLSTLLTAASAVFFAGGLLAAFNRRLRLMMLCAIAAYLLKLWYIDRMTFYYDQHRNDRRGEASLCLSATTSSEPPRAS
jgi:hypothetical protein